MRLFEPYAFYSLCTIQSSYHHRKHICKPQIYLSLCYKPIRDMLEREEVIPRCLITHFLCFKVIRGIFQLPWAYFNSLFTHFFCFKTVRNKKKYCRVLTHFLGNEAIRIISQGVWGCFNDSIAHLLCFKIIKNIFQLPWIIFDSLFTYLFCF